MTKKEMFVEIINLATAENREDIVDFANNEIELLNRRNSKESKAAKAKQEENEALIAQILEVMETATDSLRTTEIAQKISISPQKTTVLLKTMVDRGILVRENPDKKTVVYRLA